MSLHRQIDQTIKDRVETLRILSDVAAAVKTDMTSAVQTIIENQAKLGEMEKPLQDSSTISELLRESDGDDEDYQQDMEAVQSLLVRCMHTTIWPFLFFVLDVRELRAYTGHRSKKIMADQKMEDQSGPTLSDLEKLLGEYTPHCIGTICLSPVDKVEAWLYLPERLTQKLSIALIHRGSGSNPRRHDIVTGRVRRRRQAGARSCSQSRKE